MDSPDLPLVSVIMPVRDEAAFIRHSLGAVLAQDYPAERLEILVVDDGSTDGTPDVIAAMPGAERVRVIAGPGGGIPFTLNAGIWAAGGEIIVRVDGHADIAPDYVRRCVNGLLTLGVDNIGGRWEIVGESPVTQAIAAAMTSPFGVGGASWRHDTTPHETDTVPFGAYWRERLLALGGYDERLLSNEDYDLNWRLRAAGGRVWYDPAIVSTYHVKRDLRGLWRQYTRYGLWKARVLRMHPRSGRGRHFAAPGLVAALAVGLLLGVVGGRWLWWMWLPLVMDGAMYTLGNLAAAAWTARRHGWRHLPYLPLIFAILHLSWGLGFWRGIVQPRLTPMGAPGGEARSSQ